MTRAKRAYPQVIPITTFRYNIDCPHCKTHLVGGFGEHTLRFKCHYCKNPIIVEWDEEK